MYLKASSSKKHRPRQIPGVRRAKQGGFLIPLGAFIVVGLALLALAISRFTSQSSVSSVQEGLSLQAFYAAESGAQWGMSTLLFDVNNRAVADTNCNGAVNDTLTFTANGLQSCNVTVSCIVDTVAGITTSFYTLTSAANCGSGELTAQRTIQAKAFF